MNFINKKSFEIELAAILFLANIIKPEVSLSNL